MRYIIINTYALLKFYAGGKVINDVVRSHLTNDNGIIRKDDTTNFRSNRNANTTE